MAAAGGIHALGVEHALGGVFVSLGGVLVHGFEGFHHRFAYGARYSLCQELTLVVAAAGELGVVQRHGDYGVDVVEEVAGEHLARGALGEPSPQGGHVAVLDVVENGCVGVALVVEEIAGAALHGHLARHELVEGVERYVLVVSARDVHQAAAAQEFLVEL